MTYYRFTKKLQQIPLWGYLVGGLVCLLALYAFNCWMGATETKALTQSLVYTQGEYEEKLIDVAYNEETNQGKNLFILNRDYYASRLKGYESYQSQTDFRDYYADELLQLDHYHEGVYFLRWGANGDVGKGVYHGDYLAGKKVLNQALSERNLSPQSMRYGTSNWLFPVAVLNHLSSYYGIFLLVLLFGLPLLVKYEKNQIRLLLTQPTSRTKIFLTDSLLVFARFTAVVLGSLFFSFLLGTVFGQRFPFDYPILINDGTFQTMPLYYYLVSTSLLLIFSLTLIYLTCQLLVILTRHGLISLVLTLMLVGYGQGLFNSPNEYSKVVAPYVAPLYLTPQKVYTGLDFQAQREFDMEETTDVPNDYLKGEEETFSFSARANFSTGNIPASRSRFFVANFQAENTHYYAGQSFQRQIGPKLNLQNGMVVLLLHCILVGGVGIITLHRKNF